MSSEGSVVGSAQILVETKCFFLMSTIQMSRWSNVGSDSNRSWCDVQVCLWTCSTSQRTRREKRTLTSERCCWKHFSWYNTANKHMQTQQWFHVEFLTVLSLVQLTATKAGRQTLKDKNIYYILREFHKGEKDVHVSAACEKLVQVGVSQQSFLLNLQIMKKTRSIKVTISLNEHLSKTV